MSRASLVWSLGGTTIVTKGITYRAWRLYGFALLLSPETARPRRARIAYTALLALGMYVFLYVALLVLAHACVLLARRAERAEWRSWAVSVGVAFAAASPVIVAAVFQRDHRVVHMPRVRDELDVIGLASGDPFMLEPDLSHCRSAFA